MKDKSSLVQAWDAKDSLITTTRSTIPGGFPTSPNWMCVVDKSFTSAVAWWDSIWTCKATTGSKLKQPDVMSTGVIETPPPPRPNNVASEIPQTGKRNLLPTLGVTVEF